MKIGPASQLAISDKLQRHCTFSQHPIWGEKDYQQINIKLYVPKKYPEKKDPKSFKDLQIIMKRLPTTQKSRIRQNVTSMRFFLTHFPSAEKLRISINAIITLAAWLNNWKWLQRARNSRVGRMYGLGDGYLQSDRQTLHARKS